MASHSSLLVPDHYETREPFRAKFAAAYDSSDDMAGLVSSLLDEAVLAGLAPPRPFGYCDAELKYLREYALHLEHTLCAWEELKLAGGSVMASSMRWWAERRGGGAA